ncbi:MAG: NUDIX domain-containing protein [Defluviitaleaceae bacterium]|nr:NUDIX domain-containing protein [Defluviitaleaceae bacterium]
MVANHFTATGFVFDDEGRVLMIKHKKLGVWLPPGGHVDENELPCAAVLREVFEETGVRARVVSTARGDVQGMELALPMEILLEDIEGDGSHNHIDLIYLCRAEGAELRPQEAEIDGIGWFLPSQVLELDTFDNVRTSVEKAVKLMEVLA